jgi:glucose-1-phosphate cytidylyltransferase
MVPVGDRPILWHIMKHYSHHGHREFVLCLGHLGEVIKDYFLHYEARQNDVTVELGRASEIAVHSAHEEQGWRVTLANTGLDANTGARLKRVRRYIEGSTFMATYGDGVSSIDLAALLRFHEAHGKVATVTAVHPPARFGELEFSGGLVQGFVEKPQTSAGLINGGFFVFQREIFEWLSDDPGCSLESDMLERLSAEGQLMAYQHEGFWQCMDTVRELDLLNEMWRAGHAPWKNW